MTHLDFERYVADVAVPLYQEIPILPSVVIAQAILESGWGTSKLATEANALFGIKADKSWNGNVYYAGKVWEVIKGKNTSQEATFRAYSSWKESIKDHSRFLCNLSRYKNIIGCIDYKSVCRYLYEDGYATDPNYPSKLIKLIEEYGLNNYDIVRELPTPPMPEQKTKCPGGMECNYREVVYVVQKGDTLNKIASMHNMRLFDILSFNEIENPNSIYPGQIIHLN